MSADEKRRVVDKAALQAGQEGADVSAGTLAFFQGLFENPLIGTAAAAMKLTPDFFSHAAGEAIATRKGIKWRTAKAAYGALWKRSIPALVTYALTGNPWYARGASLLTMARAGVQAAKAETADEGRTATFREKFLGAMEKGGLGSVAMAGGALAGELLSTAAFNAFFAGLSEKTDGIHGFMAISNPGSWPILGGLLAGYTALRGGQHRWKRRKDAHTSTAQAASRVSSHRRPRRHLSMPAQNKRECPAPGRHHSAIVQQSPG